MPQQSLSGCHSSGAAFDNANGRSFQEFLSMVSGSLNCARSGAIWKPDVHGCQYLWVLFGYFRKLLDESEDYLCSQSGARPANQLAIMLQQGMRICMSSKIKQCSTDCWDPLVIVDHYTCLFNPNSNLKDWVSRQNNIAGESSNGTFAN